ARRPAARAPAGDRARLLAVPRRAARFGAAAARQNVGNPLMRRGAPPPSFSRAGKRGATEMKKTVVVTAFPLPVIGAGAAWATGAGGGAYTACMVRKSGPVRLINTALPKHNPLSHCTASETRVGFAQAGPAGTPGAAGQNGANGKDGSNGKDGAPG